MLCRKGGLVGMGVGLVLPAVDAEPCAAFCDPERVRVVDLDGEVHVDGSGPRGLGLGALSSSFGCCCCCCCFESRR